MNIVKLAAIALAAWLIGYGIANAAEVPQTLEVFRDMFGQIHVFQPLFGEQCIVSLGQPTALDNLFLETTVKLLNGEIDFLQHVADVESIIERELPLEPKQAFAAQLREACPGLLPPTIPGIDSVS